MGFTVFCLTVIFICLFVGVFADIKNQHEELIYFYKCDSARYCKLQNEIKKLRKDIEEMKGEKDD